jgi:3'-phosphoadenosine 5'-phosphosulfate sulfotransferase (PAPS reductase)/FAD synthetase
MTRLIDEAEEDAARALKLGRRRAAAPTRASTPKDNKKGRGR